ncbi:MAG TPA: acetate kinase, partial [Pyrinomonadaceae bacterium]|nr:acetate kinase [Pyrinomonadaceae bacterium]
AAINGADAIIFTGGIGENSPQIRQKICENLSWMGIRLDNQRNETSKGEAFISEDSSPVQIWVIPTNEELLIARDTVRLIHTGDPAAK